MEAGPLVLYLCVFAAIVALAYLGRINCYAESSAANDRAWALLKDSLSEEELRQISGSGYLELPSPNHADRIYRIPAMGGLVEVYDAGRLTMKLCARPVDPLPVADVVLLHKLMIEASETEYLGKANIHPAGPGASWPFR